MLNIISIVNQFLISTPFGKIVNEICNGDWFIFGGFLRSIAEKYGNSEGYVTINFFQEFMKNYRGDIDVMIIGGEPKSILEKLAKYPEFVNINSKGMKYLIYENWSATFVYKDDFVDISVEIDFAFNYNGFSKIYDFTVNTLAFRNKKLQHIDGLFTTLNFSDSLKKYSVDEIIEHIKDRSLITLYGPEMMDAQRKRLFRMTAKGYGILLEDIKPNIVDKKAIANFGNFADQWLIGHCMGAIMMQNITMN